MPSARGIVSGDDDMTEYERLKWEHVARNQAKMDSLCLPKLSAECQRPQANKRKKVSTNTYGLLGVSSHDVCACLSL